MIEVNKGREENSENDWRKEEKKEKDSIKNKFIDKLSNFLMLRL